MTPTTARLARPNTDGWWWCIDRKGRATMRQVIDGVVLGCDCCQSHCNARRINDTSSKIRPGAYMPWDAYEGSVWQKATEQEPSKQ